MGRKKLDRKSVGRKKPVLEKGAISYTRKYWKLWSPYEDGEAEDVAGPVANLVAAGSTLDTGMYVPSKLGSELVSLAAAFPSRGSVCMGTSFEVSGMEEAPQQETAREEQPAGEGSESMVPQDPDSEEIEEERLQSVWTCIQHVRASTGGTSASGEDQEILSVQEYRCGRKRAGRKPVQQVLPGCLLVRLRSNRRQRQQDQ